MLLKSQPTPLRVAGKSVFYCLAAAFPGCMALALAGCAGGHVGLVTGRCTMTPTACVLETRTIGPGMQWGRSGYWLGTAWRRCIQIYAREDSRVTAWKPWEGWRWFYVPLPEAPALKQISEVVGLDFHADAASTGIDLGFSQRAFTAIPIEGKGGVWEVRYNHRTPQNTRAIVPKTQ